MAEPDVLLFIGQLEGGGAEKQCFELAGALRALDVRVQVVGTQATSVTLSRYEAAGVPVSLIGPATVNDKQFSLFSPSRPLRFLARWNSLRRLLRRERPFLVHSFLPYANVIVVAQRLFAPIPVVVAGHRYAGRAGFVYNLSQAAQILLCRFCDLNLGNSKDVASFLVRNLRLPAGRVRSAVNGVSYEEAEACVGERTSARRELGLADDEIAVGMVSNLWRYKGIGDFQKAVAEVRGRGVRLKAFSVGRDVGTLTKLEAENHRLGIEKGFRFLGGRSDVCRLLRAFDLYVSASKGEGMSNAVLEAMAHGLAIIGSRAAGTPEMLDEGAAGRLFDVGDWRALASHLYELATEPSERARLGAVAAARVRHVFRPERMVSETLYAYSDACRAHPAEAEFFLRKSEESVHGWRRPVELSITPVAP